MLYLLNNITLIDRFSETLFLLGIALAIVGVSMSILSSRICRAVRKDNSDDPNDKIIVSLKVISLIIILVALVLIMLPPN